MPRKQMTIGGFQFGIESAPIELFNRKVSYRWPSQERIGRENAHQYTGIDDEPITINGSYFPAYSKASAMQLDDLKDLAKKGEPQMVTLGTGKVLGKYCITEVTEDFSNLMDDIRPRKVTFSITITKYGNDK